MAEPYTPTTDEVREDWSRVPGYLIDPAAARMSDQRPSGRAGAHLIENGEDRG